MEHVERTSKPTHIVANLYRLFGQGRLDETLDLMHPDVVLSEPGNPEVIPWAGEFHGHVGVLRFYAALADGLSRLEIDAESLQFFPIGDDRVLALGIERGTAVGSGESYVTHSAWLWTVRQDLITRLQAFHDTAAMSDAIRGSQTIK